MVVQRFSVPFIQGVEARDEIFSGRVNDPQGLWKCNHSWFGFGDWEAENSVFFVKRNNL